MIGKYKHLVIVELQIAAVGVSKTRSTRATHLRILRHMKRKAVCQDSELTGDLPRMPARVHSKQGQEAHSQKKYAANAVCVLFMFWGSVRWRVMSIFLGSTMQLLLDVRIIMFQSTVVQLGYSVRLFSWYLRCPVYINQA